MVSMLDTLRNLDGQLASFYEKQRMGDVFAEVAGIPEADLRNRSELPGIREADGKISMDVRLLGERQEGMVTVHLMSLDPGDRLNVPLQSASMDRDFLFLGRRMEEVYGYLPGEELQKQGIDSASLNDTFFDSEMGMLDAELSGNRAKLAQLEDRIARCEVRAEQDGIITSLPIREVSAVMEGMETVVLRPLDAGFAEADVLTSVAPWLTVGSRAEIRFGRKGSDTSVFGTISEIYDFASPGVSALGLAEYRVHIKIAPDDPAAAVFTEDGRHYVYRVSGGRARKTEVESEYQTGQDAVINAGLSENDTVIARADTEGVHDGVRVR